MPEAAVRESFREHAFRALTEASANLLGDPDEERVLTRILDTAASLVAADGYAIWRHTGDDWSIVSGRGLSTRYLNTHVAATGTEARILPSSPVMIPDIAANEMLKVRNKELSAEGVRSMLLAPLRIAGSMEGTVCFYFRQHTSLPPELIEVAGAFANLAGSAITTSDLYREQKRAQERYAFLATASELLSASLDYEATIQQVARAAVPTIADWCSVHVLEEGKLQRVAVAHQDPEKLKLAEIFARDYPEELREDRGAGKQLRTGESELWETVPQELLEASAVDERHLQLIRALQITSVISVPLFVREKPIGILRLITAESKRKLSRNDLELAKDLARRAAVAIENARLHNAMLESEQRFRGLFENASVPMVLATTEGRVLQANSAYCELLGYTQDEVTKLTTRELSHPDDVDRSVQALRAVGTGETSAYVMHKRYLRKDGTAIWVRATANGLRDSNGNVREAIGMIEDITDRKRAEEERERLLAQLETERSRLDAVVRHAPVGIVLAEAPSGRILMGNLAAEEIFGHAIRYSPSVSGYDEWGAYTAEGTPMKPEDFPLTRALRSGERVREDMQYRRDGGELIWIRVAAGPVLDKAGKIAGAVVIIADIDREKRAQQEALKQASRVHEVLESTTDAVFQLDREWRFSYLNQHAVDLIAGGRDLLGKNIWQEFPDAVGRQFWTQYHVAMQEKKAVEFEEYYPAPLDKWFSVHGYPTEEGIAVFFHDITEKRKAEQALRQSEKLAAAGRLAASISHEINNPLEAVTNLLYLIDQSSTLDEEIRSYLHTAQQELARVTHIATQTLRFYRQTSKAAEISLAEVLDSVLNLYRGRLKHSGVAIEQRIETDAALVGLVGELRQVFANLVGNALDATQSGGKIIVRVREATEWNTGRLGLRVIVADTGSGMSKETRKHLFEPFYTTKGITGTGLGLWVSQEIIQKHAGSVRVRSSLGPQQHGSAFSVFLPFENGLTETALHQRSSGHA